MVLDAVSNFVRGNTDAEVGTEDTTVSVDDASIFPDPSTDGEFNVVIWDVNNFPRPDQDGDVEIMRVTARDTGADELTVVRGQETTSAAAHPEGSAIHLSPTAKMFSDIETEYTAQGEDFDGQGTSEFSNLQSVNTEDVGIENFHNQGTTATIYQTTDGNNVVLDSSGAVVAGGADNLNVTDASDFGEILEYAVNTLPSGTTPRPTIYLASAPQGDEGTEAPYVIKSKASLDYNFALFGSGKNRTMVGSSSGVENDNAIEMINPAGNITRIDSVKFDGRQGDSTKPDTWLFTDSQIEILLTNVEFRDSQTWGLNSTNQGVANYIHNTWFVADSGLRVTGASDLIVTGCRFTGTQTVTFDDVDDYHFPPESNYFRDTVDFDFNQTTPGYRNRAVYRLSDSQTIEDNTITTVSDWNVATDGIGAITDGQTWSPNREGTYRVTVQPHFTEVSANGELLVQIVEARENSQYGNLVAHGGRTGGSFSFTLDNLNEDDSFEVNIRHRTGESETLSDTNTVMQIDRLS